MVDFPASHVSFPGGLYTPSDTEFGICQKPFPPFLFVCWCLPIAIFLCGKNACPSKTKKRWGKKIQDNTNPDVVVKQSASSSEMIPRPTHRGTVHHAWPIGIRPGCTSYSARRITWRRTPSAPTKLGDTFGAACWCTKHGCNDGRIYIYI